jgi:septation ring formation regulator EzrA
MTDVRKLIGKCTQNVEAFNENSRALLKELYMVASVEYVTADHKKLFDELKSQIEAAQQQLQDLNAQIDAGKAALEKLANERAAIEKDIKALDQQRLEHVASLENLRKRMEAA